MSSCSGWILLPLCFDIYRFFLRSLAFFFVCFNPSLRSNRSDELSHPSPSESESLQRNLDEFTTMRMLCRLKPTEGKRKQRETRSAYAWNEKLREVCDIYLFLYGGSVLMRMVWSLFIFVGIYKWSRSISLNETVSESYPFTRLLGRGKRTGRSS